MASVDGPGMTAAAERIGRYRWMIVALLFAATAISYIDRQMIGVLEPNYLRPEFKWTERQYSQMVIWFQLAYAVGYAVNGRVIDWLGARFGYALAVVVWTVAHVAHGAVTSITQFSIARFALGIGESGGFPGSVKAVTEWFPAKERALAIGWLNAGSNVGAIITPLIVPAITIAYGWRMAFVVTGVFGVLWLVAWLWFYRDPGESKRVGAAELAYIRADAVAPTPAPKGLWLKLLTRRETWAFASAKFFTDPIWYFYLFWLPKFLNHQYGLDLLHFGVPIAVIYLMSDGGSIAGGWLSSRLLARGASVNVARKASMAIAAVCILPIMATAYVGNLWLDVLIIGLAAAGHQAFSANAYTLPSDLFPRYAVGSVVGIGGMIGGFGGMAFAWYVGQVLDTSGSYGALFVTAGAAYFVALGVVHLLSPRLAPAEGI